MTSRDKRRQTGVVQSIFAVGKKSTAQPRPKFHVPPRGIGPISEPNENDVLCGRGGRINAHIGNVQFREIINTHKKEYLAKSTKKLDKAHIAARIVEQVRTMNPAGRFLKEDSETGMWFDIGDQKAIKKAGQALREDAPDIRQELGDGEPAGSSGDEGKTAKPKKAKSSAEVKQATKQARKASSPPSRKLPSPANKGNGSGNKRPAAGMARTKVTSQPTWTPQSAQAKAYPKKTGSDAYMSDQALIYPAFPAPQSFAMPAPPQRLPNTGNVATSGAMYMSRGHAFDGVRSVASKASGLTRTALEAMTFGGGRPGAHLPPSQVAFGRNFTPTEISGGTMSTISGFSGVSGLSTTDTHMMGSALSFGSSGFGAPNFRAAYAGERVRSKGSQVSDLTFNFMTMSGLTRSPSFGELSAKEAPPSISDASLVAMLNEDISAGGSVNTRILDPNNPSVVPSASPRLGAKRNPPAPASVTSAMSLASGGSVVSVSGKSMGSDGSWLHPIKSRTAGSINSEDNPWKDDRSSMSDVSENFMAMDLAIANSMFRGE